jgi:hypothetical protein
MTKPSIERVREILSYDPGTGEFRWRMDRRGGVKDGSSAGTVNKQGYRIIRIDMGFYKAHRLAWFYVYGEWPNGFIDHINFDASDNRIVNLREASMAENQRNRGRQKNNTTGYKGVRFDKRWRGRWYARIVVNDNEIHLGSFATAEAARAAYAEAARRLHGEFAKVD